MFSASDSESNSYLMKMCNIIDKFSPQATKLSRVFAAASLYYNYSESEKCFNLEDDTDAHGLHGWDWQVGLPIPEF